MAVEIPTKEPIVSQRYNPIALVKDMNARFRGWLSKQSLPVEVAVVTATSAAQGAAIGTFMGMLSPSNSNSNTTTTLNPKAVVAPLKQTQELEGGPSVLARNFAVMKGVNAGISSVMRRLRGKEDLQSSMVAAFGSGAMFSLVSGLGRPNQAANAITSGLFFAIFQGGLFQLGGCKSSWPGAGARADDEYYYVKTRSMLCSLGLQDYEKNFKKGLLTDSTLPLLTDSALRDANIPPGPRLLILHHVERNPELGVSPRSNHFHIK